MRTVPKGENGPEGKNGMGMDGEEEEILRFQSQQDPFFKVEEDREGRAPEFEKVEVLVMKEATHKKKGLL